MVCTALHIFMRYQIEKNEMGVACGTCGEQERCMEGFGRKT